MKCPSCGNTANKVIDSRPSDEGFSIRRRRECETCKSRFTTYEHIDLPPLIIVKKNGTKQPFNKQKVLSGLYRACEKRPVNTKTLENVADKIEQQLKLSKQAEIESCYVGELIIEMLKDVDVIAYVRFLSVYRDFKDVDDFINELNNLIT